MNHTGQPAVMHKFQTCEMTNNLRLTKLSKVTRGASKMKLHVSQSMDQIIIIIKLINKIQITKRQQRSIIICRNNKIIK